MTLRRFRVFHCLRLATIQFNILASHVICLSQFAYQLEDVIIIIIIIIIIVSFIYFKNLLCVYVDLVFSEFIGHN